MRRKNMYKIQANRLDRIYDRLGGEIEEKTS